MKEGCVSIKNESKPNNYQWAFSLSRQIGETGASRHEAAEAQSHAKRVPGEAMNNGFEFWRAAALPRANRGIKDGFKIR